MSFFSFAYCVLIPDEDVTAYTPFQGFPTGLIERQWMFQSLLQCLPPTVLELYKPSVATLQHRIAGKAPYSASPLHQSHLAQIEISPEQPFWIVFTDAITHESGQAWKNQCQIPPLLLHAEQDFKEQDVRHHLRSQLYQHCEAVFELLKDRIPKQPADQIARIRSNSLLDGKIDAEFTFRNHNTTIPNELALFSAGGDRNGGAEPLVGNDGNYVSAIVTSADELTSLRQLVPATNLYRAGRPICSLVLAAPDLYRHVSRLRRPRKAQHLESFDMLRILQKQTTYAIWEEDYKLKKLLESHSGSAVLRQRTQELHTFTTGLALRAASYLCPVIRLPPAINHVNPEVIKLTNTLAKSQSHVRKIAKVATALFDRLTDAVDNKFMERIDQDHTHIKLVANAPLEWLPVRGLPLALRHCTSRIPATPGGLTFGQLSPSPEIRLTLEHFREILILRSFKRDDPLRSDLETAVKATCLTNGDAIPARFVDVRDRAEFINALNGFGSALVIFDGHGIHPKESDIATLQLADEAVNLWDLRQKVMMPPIFFACACDTHAVNRSHVTTASGLLNCGVRSVIASFMPIRSNTAAVFVARMLLQVFQLLPDIVNGTSPRCVRWDEVFGFIQRMMYVSESIKALWPSHERWSEPLLEMKSSCTYLILTTGSGWYEAVLKAFASELGISSEIVRERLSIELPFAEVLKYLQVGNPESILICPEDPPEDWVVDSPA